VAETVTVTGSRIRNADEPSTPVTTLLAEQLTATTPGGIPEALNKMPIFTQGSTPNNATTGANGRGNNAPGYFLNLRNLGAIRTLILLDGHRVPGTFYDTTVDVDMLPQMLMSRVEVVTGGVALDDDDEPHAANLLGDLIECPHVVGRQLDLGFFQRDLPFAVLEIKPVGQFLLGLVDRVFKFHRVELRNNVE
jgi:hypothetical protein